MKELSDIALIGLGVMGESLALNMESKGFRVSVYNYIPEVTDRFMAGRGKDKHFHAAYSYPDLVASLKAPRKVFLMVTAGKAVDEVIAQVAPLLSKGDILIDGGNSHFPDTQRRTAQLEAQGLLYVGCGVSGGEEGALKGPSMMPGGSAAAWPAVQPIFQAIAAKVGDGVPCCDWVGPDGAGHFVKMVHNGIEYGDIQLICECYQVMRDALGMSNEEMQKTFAEWNKGELSSYLIEITRDILGKKDEQGQYVLDTILDTAGQKGTGKWTVLNALDEGVSLTLIAEAVFARNLSACKEERVKASPLLAGPNPRENATAMDAEAKASLLQGLHEALLAAKMVSYAQGFALMKTAAEHYGWPLDYGRIALLWRGGCIIRSVFLEQIKKAFDEDAQLNNLMLAPWFRDRLAKAQQGWRQVVSTAVLSGIATPALSAALAYYDGYRCDRSPANLLQAQRDFFGAHTYERVDRPRGEFFHTRWNQ